MIWKHALYLWISLVLIAIILWKRFEPKTTFTYTRSFINRSVMDINVLLTFITPALRFLAIFFFILAIARPQTMIAEKQITTKGIDIVLTLDVSGTMLAEDFKPQDRISVAKKTLVRFINKRENDQIGIVIFGTDAFVLSPLTTDYRHLQTLLGSVNVGDIEGKTAIGMAIAESINRLRQSQSKTKVIILLTDGENNSGSIEPLVAADLAGALGVKIYTIGIGTPEGAPVPVMTQWGKQYERGPDGALLLTKLDETTLQKIAEKTEGRYFRATDSSALEYIYDYINKLEKTEIKTKKHFYAEEKFIIFLIIGLLFMAAEWIIEKLIIRRLIG